VFSYASLCVLACQSESGRCTRLCLCLLKTVAEKSTWSVTLASFGSPIKTNSHLLPQKLAILPNDQRLYSTSSKTKDARTKRRLKRMISFCPIRQNRKIRNGSFHPEWKPPHLMTGRWKKRFGYLALKSIFSAFGIFRDNANNWLSCCCDSRSYCAQVAQRTV